MEFGGGEVIIDNLSVVDIRYKLHLETFFLKRLLALLSTGLKTLDFIFRIL